MRDGVPLPGANGRTLTLPAGEFSAHEHRLHVSNSLGAATSEITRVVIIQPAHLLVDLGLGQLRLKGTPGAWYSLSDSPGAQTRILNDGTIIIPSDVWYWTQRTTVETSAAEGEAIFALREPLIEQARFWKADIVP